jgi:hypothetical protein
MKKILFVLFCLVICGCAHQFVMPENYEYNLMQNSDFNLATWQKISNSNQPIHIYIEGDGRAFYANGAPTADPTPHDSFMRDLVVNDSSANVVYIARPCQFINDSNCNVSVWTNGRFSKSVIDSVAATIKQIAGKRPVVLIGYSGGAMVTGLVIKQHPEINIKKWITIAGVLNHHDWTEYFGDANLDKSLDMDSLPNVPQIHYAGDKDNIVPIELSQKWIPADKLKIISGATHNNFPNLEIDFY